MNIVFLDEYSLGGIDLSRIKQLGNYTGYEKTTPGEIAERCIDADIVITNKVPLRAEAIKVLPQLKLICIAATGMNNVDLEAAAERGIEVRNAVGYSTHAVTETTIGAAIALLRQSIYYDRYVKSGEYAASDAPFHFGRPLHQLYGKRWGIIGLGAIGHKVAEVAAALGCQIAYTSTSGVERQEPYPAMPLDELLRWSDIVSIHAPLNDRTRGLVGARELALMKPSALLINVARGGIVDEQALADALDNKRLAGAGIDVFSREGADVAGQPPAACNRPRPVAALAPHGLGPGRSTRNIGRLHRTEYRNLFGRTAIVRRRRSDRMRKPRTELKFSPGFSSIFLL